LWEEDASVTAESTGTPLKTKEAEAPKEGLNYKMLVFIIILLFL
jgi:hypothetical protein